MQGLQSFVGRMKELGLDPVIEKELVIYQVLSVDGSQAGCTVETGVDVSELEGWPRLPPHWIHLSDSINFINTNSDVSSKTGWLKHSRDCTGWGDSEPGISWLSHVRFVLSEAI